MNEKLRSFETATWCRGLAEEEPSRSIHNFSTPPALEILHLLPVAYRVGTYIYTERSNGREPIFDMSGIQLQPPNPGPYGGAPLGGIGSGSIGRGFRGDFRRWSLNPGRYSHQVVESDVLCVRVKHGNKVEARVLSVVPPSSESCLNSWNFDMKPSCATYYARFPFAWTVYEDPVAHVKVVVKQTSPFIPGNYSESCLPTSVFDVDVQNRSRDVVEVSLMFVFQNGLNEENSKRELSRFEHEVFEVSDPSPSSLTAAEHQGPSIKGIQMRHTCRFQSGKPQNPPPSATSRGACDGDATPTSSMCWASSDAKDTSPQPKTSLDHNSFAIACSSEPGDPVTVTMCPKFQTRHSHDARRGLQFCADGERRQLLDLEKEHAAELWKMFVAQGELAPLAQYGDDARNTLEDDGIRYGAALCLQRRVAPTETANFRLALAWDYPIARFGSGFGLPRYFTRFFASDGAQASAIAAYALQHVDRWADAIVQWQAETLAQLDKTMAKLQGQQPGRHLVPLTSEEVAFYQSQVFNELYFLVDGGSVWTDSSAGVSNQARSFSNAASTATAGAMCAQPRRDLEDEVSPPPPPASTATGSKLASRGFLSGSSVATTQPESELQKRLLDDESPDTVATAQESLSPSPLATAAGAENSPRRVIERTELRRLHQQMQENDAQVHACGGNQTHVGQFLYLEGHEYLMYNTYDVHFYASFALIMLWPELELSLQRDIADSVLKEDPTERTMMGEGCTRPRKVKNVVPHDVGSPSETPWVLPNVYNFQDVSNWKDLGTKFVLQVYRDVYYLQERYSKAGASPAVLTEYLRSFYRVLCIVMRHEESFDTNGDGMIDNSGFPDQTYDIWTAKGVHAYCGGLWITACEAMVAIATRLEDTPTALHYRSLADRARTVYIDQLWNPINHYFHYDNSTSAHHDSIMSDMLAGQWYARACGLPNMVSTEKIHHALAVIFRWNVQAFGQGAVPKGQHDNGGGESAWRGAVNGTRPVRDASSRQIVRMTVDQTCLQSREVWTGTTYALAATMLQEALHSATTDGDGGGDGGGEAAARASSEGELRSLGQMAFATSRGIHDGGWQAYGYWFATPEGWEQNGNYRSLGYMRALAIWAMQYAMETAPATHPAAAST